MENARVLVVNDASGADSRLTRVGGWDGLISADLLTDPERRRDLGLPSPPQNAAAIRPMALGAWEVTDTLLVGLTRVPADLDLAPTRLEGRAVWISFGFLLRNAASRLLDVDPSGSKMWTLGPPLREPEELRQNITIRPGRKVVHGTMTTIWVRRSPNYALSLANMESYE